MGEAMTRNKTSLEYNQDRVRATALAGELYRRRNQAVMSRLDTVRLNANEAATLSRLLTEYANFCQGKLSAGESDSVGSVTPVDLYSAEVITGIKPVTIRSWVNRGKLHPIGKNGRKKLYALEDVYKLIESGQSTA